MSPKRILVVQPNLQPAGGGNTVAVCIVEALKRENVISILSWDCVDINPINRFFGTSLKASEFRSLAAPLFMRVLLRICPYLSPLKYAFLLRLCKKIRNHYDVIISVNNEADFYCRGIQYVHEPPYWFHHLYSRPRPSFKLLMPHHVWAVFKGRHRPWMFVAGFSYQRMKNNLTLVNSHWTRRKLWEIYGIDSITLYPPILSVFPNVSWEERENGFVCIGRLSPWKNLDKIVDIIGRVRSEIPDTHLHIIGTKGERRYFKRLLHLAEQPWIFLNENVSREELVRLVTGHRYGIHGMLDEPFGIAVAEMLLGGCIVFVPRNGGPMEIAGGDDRLLYETIEMAVEKIVRVMKSPADQASLRNYLESRKDLFSPKRFIKGIREVVRQFSKNTTLSSQEFKRN